MAKKFIYVLCFLVAFFGCKKNQEEKKFTSDNQYKTSNSVEKTTTSKPEQKIKKEKQKKELEKFSEKKLQEEPKNNKEEPVYPPKIEFISYELLDTNKNGKIDSGEKIQIKIKIKNVGKGPGENLTLKIDTEGILQNTAELELEKNGLSISQIAPGQIKEFTISFYAPSKIPEKIPIKLFFSEGTKYEFTLDGAKKPMTEKERKVEQVKEKIKKKMEQGFQELDNELK